MDSWEDDEADLTLPGAVAPSANNWDDEEEEDEVETVAAAPQASSTDAAPKAEVEVDPDAVVVKLESMNDHLKLVTILNERFVAKKSKDSHVLMFAKELLKTNEARFSPAELNDLIIMLTNQKTAKEKVIDKPTESNKTKKSKKKSKKEQLETKKKHADIFGEGEAGEYDHYDQQYDDFF